MLRFAFFIPLLFLAACDKKADAPAVQVPYQQRFVYIQNDAGNMALDTQTGLMCKTWYWDNRNFPDLSDALPVCNSLYRKADDYEWSTLTHKFEKVSVDK